MKRPGYRFFDPFYTSWVSRRSTGLLSDGASISIRSKPGRGTTINVCFPSVDPHEERSDDPVNGNSLCNKAETVLVVEDDELVRGVMVGGLRSLGFSVLCAPVSERALELVRRSQGRLRIDLLITNMVKGGGRPLYQQLQVFLPKLKVLQ